MIVPGYWRMVKRFVKWANEDPGARVLAIGPWAKKDFLRMGVRAEKIVDWGYFVERRLGLKDLGLGPDKLNNLKSNNQTILNVLWCGRMLGLKRVDTLIRAVARIREEGRGTVDGVKLTLVGDGPEKRRLMSLAEDMEGIEFLPLQSPEKVRQLMCEHDLYVFASNGYEGWGAVVSEALEEGMSVIGTFEAGASATLLPKERLFHCGDWKTLARLIEKEARGELPPCRIGEWTAAAAAKRLLKIGGAER